MAAVVDGRGAGRGVSISLSGGGHRAALFALGALLYLTDAGKNGAVSSIASVSGGSLTNAHLAQTLDFQSAENAEIDAWAARFGKRIAKQGTLFATPITWLYLCLVLLLLLAVVVGVWFLPLAVWARVLLFFAGLLLIGWVLQVRAAVVGRAFAATLFSRAAHRRRSRKSTRRSTMSSAPPISMLGNTSTSPAALSVATASALGCRATCRCIPPYRLRRAFRAGCRHGGYRRNDTASGSPATRPPPRRTTWPWSDGGVYDNMGDQWAQGLAARKRRGDPLADQLHDSDELIVVNASAGMAFHSTASLRLPLVGEFTTLLRDKSVCMTTGRACGAKRSSLASAWPSCSNKGCAESWCTSRRRHTSLPTPSLTTRIRPVQRAHGRHSRSSATRPQAATSGPRSPPAPRRRTPDPTRLRPRDDQHARHPRLSAAGRT